MYLENSSRFFHSARWDSIEADTCEKMGIVRSSQVSKSTPLTFACFSFRPSTLKTVTTVYNACVTVLCFEYLVSVFRVIKELWLLPYKTSIKIALIWNCQRKLETPAHLWLLKIPFWAIHLPSPLLEHPALLVPDIKKSVGWSKKIVQLRKNEKNCDQPTRNQTTHPPVHRSLGTLAPAHRPPTRGAPCIISGDHMIITLWSYMMTIWWYQPQKKQSLI